MQAPGIYTKGYADVMAGQQPVYFFIFNLGQTSPHPKDDRKGHPYYRRSPLHMREAALGAES